MNIIQNKTYSYYRQVLRCFYTVGEVCRVSVEQLPESQVEEDNVHRRSTFSLFCCCTQSYPASAL